MIHPVRTQKQARVTGRRNAPRGLTETRQIRLTLGDLLMTEAKAKSLGMPWAEWVRQTLEKAVTP
jgi:hypothetical protein